MTDADLLHALRDCYLSGGRNIVDAKLVKAATLEQDDDAPGAKIPGVPTRYRARVTLYAPGADETVNAQLVAQIENRLLGLQAIAHVDVTLRPALFPIL